MFLRSDFLLTSALVAHFKTLVRPYRRHSNRILVEFPQRYQNSHRVFRNLLCWGASSKRAKLYCRVLYATLTRQLVIPFSAVEIKPSRSNRAGGASSSPVLIKQSDRGGQYGDYPRFLAIVGASGSGKSSVARAGLVAALKHPENAPDMRLVVVVDQFEEVFTLCRKEELRKIKPGLEGESAWLK